MDDQCSADDAQLDALSQASYVPRQDARAIGVNVDPVYDTAIAYAVTDDVTCSSSLDDDDMLRWLHCPAEDLIDKGCCSDIFGGLPLSDLIPETSVPFSMAHVATMNLSTEAEAAMALGFGRGRVVGLVKQPGLEAFNKVRTTLLPPILSWDQIYASKLQNLIYSQLNEKKEDLSPSFDPSPLDKSPTNCDHVNLPLSKFSALISQTNFPHFSSLAATEIKCRTRIASHIQQESSHCTIEGNNRTDGSTAESGTSAGDASKSHRELDTRSAFVKSQSSQARCSASHETSSKPADALAHKGVAECQLQLDMCQNFATLGRASSKDTQSPQLGDSVEFTEVTVTTSSGGSGNLCWKMTPSNLKKDSREMDFSTDLQSEDAGESSLLKKPATGRGSFKRNRAAEVHNLSERRRRDRINEKMKALQELIPNSDKCDKASILDEAIEYVKLLQIQIQHMQMPQVTSLPYLGMGLPNLTSTGHQTIALQSLAGTAHISSGPSCAANAHNQLQCSSVIDNHSGYMDHQQLQIASQPLNVDVWNAYMMHQLHYHQVHQGNPQNQQPNNA
ncbi:hypothetical protein O6H91_Y153000 [Diphasiastrum complanatum]|nr:hypothetical protein O6H91_Y153000 [Diphasiastrum complanatum]KAJ7299794.1 hypothetical protein O6H91_Y153000 [Diphasiastrum complanatum]